MFLLKQVKAAISYKIDFASTTVFLGWYNFNHQPTTKIHLKLWCRSLTWKLTRKSGTMKSCQIVS